MKEQRIKFHAHRLTTIRKSFQNKQTLKFLNVPRSYRESLRRSKKCFSFIKGHAVEAILGNKFWCLSLVSNYKWICDGFSWQTVVDEGAFIHGVATTIPCRWPQMDFICIYRLRTLWRRNRKMDHWMLMTRIWYQSRNTIKELFGGVFPLGAVDPFLINFWSWRMFEWKISNHETWIVISRRGGEFQEMRLLMKLDLSGNHHYSSSIQISS